MKRDNIYEERDSPFFRLRSRKKLAKLLFISKTKLEMLAREENLYTQFQIKKKNGGIREISAPRNDLKAVQKRIAVLLQRITPPEYLFAPVSGRSYVDNAAKHLGAESIRLLDIVDFYPSCTANKVIWFFQNRMQCSQDVSAIIKGIVTHDESLPQGSPCSPILAYFSYIDMWEEIEQIVKKGRCTLTVYADDLTISGKTVPEAAIWEIKKTLIRHGHHYSVNKERSKHLKPAEVTGVILSVYGLRAPNRQHQKLHDLRRHLDSAISYEEIIHLKAQLVGRVAQMNQISSGNPG